MKIFEIVKHFTPLALRRGVGGEAWVGLLVVLLASCSNISEDERLIYVAPAEVQRAVLIEDFTGQACVNCPAATAQIHELQQTYGEENIIAVAIHSGPFAHRRSNMGNDFLSDLGTTQGDDYYTHWGIEAQPGVKINRGDPIYDTKQYAAAIAAEMKKTSPEYFQNLSAKLTNDDKIAVGIIPSALANNTDMRLQIWIVEDGINAEGGNSKYVQLLPDNKSDVNYVHNHVFRASMTHDPYGDDISLWSNYQTVYMTKREAYWNKDNLFAVVFFWTEKEGVLEVKRLKVTE